MEKDKTPIENVDEEIIKRYNLDTYDDEDDGKHPTCLPTYSTSNLSDVLYDFASISPAWVDWCSKHVP